MPVNTAGLAGLSPRPSCEVLLLDDPLLGHLQAIVLKKLQKLGKDAYGSKALMELSLECGVWLDPSQVYASLRKLLKREYIMVVEKRPSYHGGPPFIVYKLTETGVEALKKTAMHHKAVSDYLNY